VCFQQLNQTRSGQGFAAKKYLLDMILELAILNVIPEKTTEFEASFEIAREIISTMKGWLGHELQQCIEVPNRYVLLVKWDKLEDHTEGFRKSPGYTEWRKLLHHFYDPFPLVEHYLTKSSARPQAS
jgi:heme-degrading monooxygenase HmoA